MTQRERERKKEWKRSSGSGVDSERQKASGSAGESGMWVVWDFINFFFLTVRYVSWDFRYVSNLGGSKLNIYGLDLEFWIGFGFGIWLD